MSSAELDASLNALQPTALVAPFSRGAAGGPVAPRPAAQPPTFRASSIYTQADGFVPDTSVAARTVVMTESASGGVAAMSARGKSLLPGEGAVGAYDDLIAAGSKGDNITPHHIPSAHHMAQHGVSKGGGIAINMEQPFPGSGGRHRATFTYGTRADLNLTSRQALGRGVWDARRIYQQDDLYSPEIRSSLQELIRQNRAANPGLFDK
jgi:hypothetical protein